MISKLRLGPDLTLPLDAVTETFGILAVKRAGKSNAAVVVAEEMYDAGLPWVAVDPKGDWWGVRAAGDGESPGLSVLVFGGAHGDVPLEPGSGRLVADLVVDARLTCVLDVSEMTKADMRRFLHDFADRLYRRNREPLHVFCEEADEYIPQQVRGESAKVVGAFETLVKRGGFKGIGVTLITQRSASLNKDVLTQVGSLFVLRTTSPQDRKAIAEWIKYHAAAEDTIAELSGLDNGEAFLFSPQWLRTLARVRFRRRRTFDSGATPKVGAKPRPPARLADVDVAAIKDAMAETIERAKADDPTELRKEIARLRRNLAEKPTAPPETVNVPIPVLPDGLRELLAGAADDVQAFLDGFDFGMKAFSAAAERHVALRDRLEAAVRLADAVPPEPGVIPRIVKMRAEDVADFRVALRDRLDPKTTTPRTKAGRSDLPPGERKILTAVAQHPEGVDREQLTVLAGYRKTSRDTYVQRLRQRAYLAVDGPILRATAEGIAALGDDFEPLPTGDALRAYWLDRLPDGERKILRLLSDAYPNEVDADWISDETGYKKTSRDTYLQRLRAKKLVTKPSAARFRAADLLFGR